ncbi:hypothetical protein A0U90_06415 [Kozakia baliensis]|nr:hypothetical protein A0U90_06415 [Kozakia baliensis]
MTHTFEAGDLIAFSQPNGPNVMRDKFYRAVGVCASGFSIRTTEHGLLAVTFETAKRWGAYKLAPSRADGRELEIG